MIRFVGVDSALRAPSTNPAALKRGKGRCSKGGVPLLSVELHTDGRAEQHRRLIFGELRPAVYCADQ